MEEFINNNEDFIIEEVVVEVEKKNKFNEVLENIKSFFILTN